MTERIQGNYIEIEYEPNELSNHWTRYTLPDGYSFQEIYCTKSNISMSNFPNVTSSHFTFPVVNGKSPCCLNFSVVDLTKTAYLGILIEKFGGEPDINYFNGAFEPILVKRKDGTSYNMIPTRDKGGV